MRASRPTHCFSPSAPPRLDLAHDALFLDLDGTLVDIEAQPELVTGSPELRDLLTRLSGAMNHAVALITGRTLDDADRILHGALAYVAGVHGFEVKRNSEIAREDIALAPLARASTDLEGLAHAKTVSIENKKASLALHYRHAPEIGPEVLRTAHEIAAKHGLRVIEGKMVVELAASSRTKGDALDLFMSAAPFQGRRPVVLGDDVTDEDAFAAAHNLGGHGVLVVAARDTAAAYHLANPRAVQGWLAASLSECKP